MCSRGKNIRVKENLENKGANGNSNNAGCWEDSPGLVAGREPQPLDSAGRRARGVTAPPWKLGIKEGQTAGKDGPSGLLSAGLCTQTRAKERGVRDRVPQAAALALPLRFRFLPFLPSSVPFLLRQDLVGSPGYLAGLESVVSLLSVVPKC